MRFRRSSRHSVLPSLLLLVVSELSAGTLQELFKAATSINQDRSLYEMDLELAELRLGKAEIEAAGELERASAEATYAVALAEYRRLALLYFNEVIDLAFAAATAELDSAIAALRLENARESRRYAESRYLGGLVSEEGLKQADIALRTATTDQELAAWTYQDSKDTVFIGLGLQWEAGILPELPPFVPEGSQEDWLRLDATLRRARCAERIAVLRTATLMGNAPSFDRQVQRLENLKAAAAVTSAESDARRAFDGIVRRLNSQKAVLGILTEEDDLQALATRDAVKRYEGGLISLSDMNLQRISAFNARKALLQARKTSIKTIGEYSLYLGIDPMGL